MALGSNRMEINNVNIKLKENYVNENGHKCKQEIIFTHNENEFLKIKIGGFIMDEETVRTDYFFHKRFFDNLKKILQDPSSFSS